MSAYMVLLRCSHPLREVIKIFCKALAADIHSVVVSNPVSHPRRRDLGTLKIFLILPPYSL
jgi:hypothetical protein